MKTLVKPIKSFTFLSLFSVFFLSMSAQASECPSGFISVPGDTTLGAGDFCVMKYEAKAWKDSNSKGTKGEVDKGEIHMNGCVGDCRSSSHNWGLSEHVPVSVSQGRPWRHISRDNAIKECQELNDVYTGQKRDMEFDLISNKEWQTIARNIEKQEANWSGGKVGSGCLNQGNNGLNTECSYSGGGLQSSADERSSHVLSNGEKIFYLAGNIWEWVKDDNKSKQGQDQYMSEYSYKNYAPEGNFTCNADNQYCGFGFGWLDYSAGAVLRGGFSISHDHAGVFATYLSYGPSASDNDIGFRCVFRSRESITDPDYD